MNFCCAKPLRFQGFTTTPARITLIIAHCYIVNTRWLLLVLSALSLVSLAPPGTQSRTLCLVHGRCSCVSSAFLCPTMAAGLPVMLVQFYLLDR